MIQLLAYRPVANIAARLGLAPSPSEMVKKNKRFAVMGDAGSGDTHQYAVARRMWRTYCRNPFSHVVVLGDNVYEDGEPKFFEERIKKPYRRLWKAGVEFDPVLGNHDVRGGFADEQLRFWNVPRWYSFKMGDSDSNNAVEFFAIDTTLMLPLCDNAHINDLPAALRMEKAQRQWLETALTNSTARYKVVYGHYPMYSSGSHSYLDAKNNNLMRTRLEPLLTHYGVDLYMAGHEHLYERSAPIGGVRHIVSGAGSKLGAVMVSQPDHPRVTAQSRYHFMLFEITPCGLLFKAIDRKGHVMDKGLIPPKAARTLAFA